MHKDFVCKKLGFAENRMCELLALNGGDLPGANGDHRQQLIQEFFFHLAGSIEILAQLINDCRGLKFHAEDVSIQDVAGALDASDPIKPVATSLYLPTRKKSLPADPYSDDGYIFRLLNYRHHVTHRMMNPFFIRLGPSERSASLQIDPRDKNIGPASKTVAEELRNMFRLVESRCNLILTLL